VVVTIIAASIPFFRVLLRHLTSSYSRSRQFRANSYRLQSYGNGTDLNDSRIGRRGVKEITAVKANPTDRDLDDISESERSILGRGVGTTAGITKCEEVVVEYSSIRKG
jgi:hypothetical protein